MDDRIRTSDADRDRIAARLRDHFAEGRLTPDELDQRVTATLNAKTFGDLRRVMADLPEPAPVPRQAQQLPPRAVLPGIIGRRGPRILPLAALALLAILLIPGAGWLFLAFFNVLLVFGLVACLTGILMAVRFRRHMRRDWPSGYSHYRSQDWLGGYAHYRSRCWRM